VRPDKVEQGPEENDGIPTDDMSGLLVWVVSEETGYSEWCANDRGETTKRLLLGLRLLGEKGRVDVRQDAAASDGDRAQELVQLLVVADGELDVARHDARLLVVAHGVARELEDLGAEVLEDGAHVHARGHGRARRPAAQVAREARARELESRLGRRRRAGRALGLVFAAATFPLPDMIELCIFLCDVLELK